MSGKTRKKNRERRTLARMMKRRDESEPKSVTVEMPVLGIETRVTAQK